MGNSIKKYEIRDNHIIGLLKEINKSTVLPDINMFVQQIFYENDNCLGVDKLCIQYYKRFEFGFQYIRSKLVDYEVSNELAKFLFMACLDMDFKEAVAIFDHLALIKPDLQEILLPLLIDHQVKLFKENIRVRFRNNKTNRLLNDYRQKLINALVSETV